MPNGTACSDTCLHLARQFPLGGEKLLIGGELPVISTMVLHGQTYMCQMLIKSISRITSSLGQAGKSCIPLQMM